MNGPKIVFGQLCGNERCYYPYLINATTCIYVLREKNSGDFVSTENGFIAVHYNINTGAVTTESVF